MQVNSTVAISGLGLLALLSVVLLVLVVREHRRRRRAEVRLAEVLEDAPADARSRQASRQEILGARSLEQRRISHELHDGVSQNLAGIAMLLKGLEQRLLAEAPACGEDLARIADLIQKSSAKARDLVLSRQAPVNIKGDDLATALGELADRTQLLFAIPCACEIKAEPRLEKSTVHQLLAVAEEAVTNAVRHADADHITFLLEKDRDLLTLAVEDDGCGITGEAQDLHSRGQRVMVTRIEKLGGHLTFEPRLPRGTRVACQIPLPRHPPRGAC